MASTKKTDSAKKPARRAPKTAPAAERIFEGLGVAPGVAIGPAYLREGGDLQVVELQIPANKVGAEVERFREAVAKSQRQIAKLKSRATSVHGAAAEELGYLLDAHLQMLKSGSLGKGVERRISEHCSNAEAAVMGEIGAIAQNFEAMDDAFLQTRAREIREIGHRIVRNLVKSAYVSFSTIEPGSIIVAEEVTPSDTALMDPKRIAGFVSALGGAESHTAIMARSLGLPAVLGVPGLVAGIKTGDRLIVDGSNGLVFVNPSAACLADYQRRQSDFARQAKALARLRGVAAVTRDGERIRLHANLELPREIGQAVAAGAEGVGLLRTEFLFMNRNQLPDEEEQYRALTEILAGLAGRTLTVRTLDLGGDKLSPALGLDLGAGANPALGLRAIRLGLVAPAVLEAQLAAILRAGAHGPLRILLPMVTSLPELREVRRIVHKVARRLKRRRVKIADPLPPLGVMIEVPGAALAADALATAADFFALGTNDLTMYTLAIDRGEERVAHLFNPLHPAVLRLVQFSIEAALRARIPVSVCGEIAGDPRYTALLLGLGVRELSMSANALPRVKSRILSLDLQAATRRALLIMDQVDSGRIVTLLDDFNALA
ncbi:MAG: phosphoenolpyruvate--protein phosphotransferase [Kiloniellales bacterium]